MTANLDVYRAQRGVHTHQHTVGDKLMRADNFDGDLRSYLSLLKSNSENMFTTEEEMLQAFRDTVKEINTRIPTVLDNPPQFNISIVRAASANAPTGRYTEPTLDGSRGGIFYANIYGPQTRSRFGVMSLTLHEVMPGHHTQMSYSIKEKIPNFRRAVEYRKYYAIPFNWPFYTAYGEGWALYAESLGEEMGLFSSDPKSLLGRYTSEILRACRLVVDTGIHEFGWNASTAEEYLLKYSNLPVAQIKTDVKRYTSYPGQATSYKIGELTIKRLRKEAEQTLETAFNLKDFHRTILQLGPVPLSTMERVIRKWIEGEAAIMREIRDNESNRVSGNGVTLVGVVCLTMCAVLRLQCGYI